MLPFGQSFCMALLEAASCGLLVVSTKVGGVPEVLPPSMIKFAEPNPDALAETLADAILISRRTVPSETHIRVQSKLLYIVLHLSCDEYFDFLFVVALIVCNCE